jgi:hypothetical protein
MIGVAAEGVVGVGCCGELGGSGVLPGGVATVGPGGAAPSE